MPDCSTFIRCYYCGARTALTAGRYYRGGLFYCINCYNRQFVNCTSCDAPMDLQDSWSNPSCDRICHDCFDETCITCDDCGGSVWNEDIVEINNHRYCCNCANYRLRSWDSKPFVCETPSYNKIGSTRKFGVELETSSCPQHLELRDNTIWACKPDCSIEGLEFVSPVLFGDQGLNEIKVFCADARRRHWHVNRYCGYHVHFDMTNENWKSLRSIAFAYYTTYDLWRHFVSDARANNSMCGVPGYGLSNIKQINGEEDWDYFVGGRDRFEFVNWRAYFVHGTMEVRLHDASLATRDILNWIKVHARFIDFVKDLSLDDLTEYFTGNLEKQFDAFSEIVGSKLTDFYAHRAEIYRKPVRLVTYA